MAAGGQKSVGYRLVNIGPVTLENTDSCPFYTGIVMCEDTIIVTDFNTCTVRLHRVNDGTLLDTHRLNSYPRDMCLIYHMVICVILLNGLIEIMSIDSTYMTGAIKWTRTLDIQGALDVYYGVVRFKDNLVVSGVRQDTMYFCNVALDDGHVEAVHQICKGDIDESYVTTKDNMIYISCHAGSNSPDTGVYGYDILNPSHCKYTYKHEDLDWPTSIVTSKDGLILVCNNGFRSSIHQLTEECQLVSIFKHDIPRGLRAIFWDRRHGYFIVACDGSTDNTRYRPENLGNITASVSDERKQPIIEVASMQIGERPESNEISSVKTEMNPSLPVYEHLESCKQGMEQESVRPTVQDVVAAKKSRSILSSGKDEIDQRKEEIVDILFQNFNNQAFAVFLTECKGHTVLEYVFKYILKTNHREALCMTLGKIQAEWRETFHDSKLVIWVGSNYCSSRDGELTLVCYHMNDTRPKESSSNYLGMPVLYRHFNKIEKEPLDIRIQQTFQHMSLSESDARFIEQLIQRHSDELFNTHSNLEAISASSVISSKTRGLVEETAIILYCRLKGVIPFGEPLFPRELNIEGRGFSTDVREGFFSFGMHAPQMNAGRPNPRNWNNPLKIGCSVGNYNSNSAGTLGPFVRLAGGANGFLTCAHVFGVSSIYGGIPIFAAQPANGEASNQVAVDRRCGVLQHVVFDTNRAISIDAALVQIDKNAREIDPTGFVWDHSSELLQAGFSEMHPPSFQNGVVIEELDFGTAVQNRVIKCGRSTGLTKGSFALRGPAIRIHDALLNLPNGMVMNSQTSHIMNGQYIVEGSGNEPFFKGGDSGSGVYLVNSDNKLALVGIAIGSLTPGDCVVTPIVPVLTALGLNKDSVMTEDDMDHDD